ncbi:MAG: hypothetical protein J4G09_02200 [Proteobacteria bacterium]|nr:hypothetical protein [Pseudomonadota bacterium]
MKAGPPRPGALARGALLVAFLAACGAGDVDEAAPGTPLPDSETEPVRGDWLVLRLGADPENLNPLTSNDSTSSRVLRWIFPPLNVIDEDTLELEPLLARELPEIAPDRLGYVYRLRNDVTFSDGVPFTAHDVIFTLKATLHPKVAAPHSRNYFNSIAAASVIDEHALSIRLKEVYFRNEYVLGSISPIPRHYYDPDGLLDGISVAELIAWDELDADKRERASLFAERFNRDFQRRPLGPGAYALVDPAADFVTGQRIVLRRRPDFWAPGNIDLEDGWVDRVVFRIVNDNEAALVALKRGDLDHMGLNPIQHLRATGTPGFARRFDKFVHQRGFYSYIGWNQKRRLFRDRRVRQALSHLVDKRNIVDKVLFGLGEPVESPVSSLRPEHNAALAPWPFDPERASKLLAEAGWRDTDGDGVLDKRIGGESVPLEFEIISNAGNEQRRKVALTALDAFGRVGVRATFRSLDWSIMLDRVRNYDFDAVVLGWVGGILIPPDLYQIWHSSQAVEGGSNYVGFRNEEADRILEAYRVEFDPAERKRLYDRLQEILYAEQPYTFLYTPKTIEAWDRRFEGVRWIPGVGSDLHEWWVPVSRQRH